MNNQELIVHICPGNTWEEAQDQGIYRTPSLETEGFIHCSRPDQVLKVANSFYKKIPDLVLLWINSQKVKAQIKHELGAEGTSEKFPHIYGPVNLDAVLAIYDFYPASDGIYKLVPGSIRFENN